MTTPAAQKRQVKEKRELKNKGADGIVMIEPEKLTSNGQRPDSTLFLCPISYIVGSAYPQGRRHD